MAQSKDSLLKSYNTRLKEDVKSMLENFDGNLKPAFSLLEAFSLFISFLFALFDEIINLLSLLVTISSLWS